MHITPARQSAEIRVAKVKVALAEAIDKAIDEVPELTEAELLLALAETSLRYTQHAFMEQTPQDNAGQMKSPS